MANYSSVGSFGGIFFSLGSVSPSQKPATLKTQLGKQLIETRIPLKNTVNKVLQINGIITGLSRTAGQTLSAAIENDRASLIALEDGTYHAYDDGRHSGNFVMVPGSLVWEDVAETVNGEPRKFTMTLIEW